MNNFFKDDFDERYESTLQDLKHMKNKLREVKVDTIKQMQELD